MTLKKSWRLIAFVAAVSAVGLFILRFSVQFAGPVASDRGVSSYDSEASSEATLQFLLDRVGHDPDDFVAQNMLSSHLLQKVRETGDADLFERARRAAQASLRSVPAERNSGGLSALARAEMIAHDFAGARVHALMLTHIDPGSLASWSVLADTLLELGDYADADVAIQTMRKLGGETADTEIRLGRLLFLEGDTPGALKHLFRASAFVQHLASPPREIVAWCLWQYGELEFSAGDYRSAERHYRDALKTFPLYVQALASLGRVRAARGDLADAIAQYEAAVRKFPDPAFVAALGDLYHLAGRQEEADRKYALVEYIARLSVLNGVRYNRQIALFYADHDRNLNEAYDDAVREYAERKDIYGADAFAWSALKAGQPAQAKQAIQSALRLSTCDARIFYHAGMIAQALGENETARDYLRRALALNPGFDPLQSIVAHNALNAIRR